MLQQRLHHADIQHEGDETEREHHHGAARSSVAMIAPGMKASGDEEEESPQQPTGNQACLDRHSRHDGEERVGVPLVLDGETSGVAVVEADDGEAGRRRLKRWLRGWGWRGRGEGRWRRRGWRRRRGGR